MENNNASLLYKAQLSELTERYDDVYNYMRSLIKTEDIILNVEKNQLFSDACKHVVGSRRQAYFNLNREYSSELDLISPKVMEKYKTEIRNEVHALCQEIIMIIDENLLPNASCPEIKVENFKLKGDMFRYLAECGEDERNIYAESAIVAYKDASLIATENLSPTHPVRLAVALNLSCLFFDLLDMPQRAKKLAQIAINNCTNNLDYVDQKQYQETMTILQLLKDNLVIWSNRK